MFNILLAEDDKNARRYMEVILQENGYEVRSAKDGEEALEIFQSLKADCILLDVMMPKMNGYEVARAIRSVDEETPILMITAKGELNDRKEGFLSGTDDYMVKPVDEEEMLLRIKALLRRSKKVTEHKLLIGDVTLDYDSLSVIKGEEVTTLPQKEFYLLYKLLSNPNKIYTRLQLMDEIWGMDTDSADNTVNVHINRLRNRFENYSEFEIVTIRGLGYKGVRNV
ncbi:MAG: response regulator transcription factor [Erysipelotrichaceae bacterium]|nr:response regulator transcription factor [Erysipelotrichaceae bacterium]